MNNIGKKGELLAANYLIAHGYKILEKNYYNKKGYKLGEVDLIGQDKKGRVIFFEVKARKGRMQSVAPEERINDQKLKTLFKIAHIYLREKDWLEKDWRVDFVGVFFDFHTRKAAVRHIKGLYI
ncbi:MAG: YraN family protein [Candidatus Moranbacteria bacterium]|nr:YraN family protein [Candidatus Moranbacteria bacterium]